MSKSTFGAFCLGAVLGAATAWLCLKKYYADIAQEEIDSVKETFSGRANAKKNILREDKSSKKPNDMTLKPDLVDYMNKLQEEGYVNYTEHSKKSAKETDTSFDDIRVIAPEVFGDLDEHTLIGLTYYAGDKVLADDGDEIVEDLSGTVGEDFADHFGEYEDDAVFVRNDRLKCDYEICRDPRSFADVVGFNNE